MLFFDATGTSLLFYFAAGKGQAGSVAGQQDAEKTFAKSNWVGQNSLKINKQ